MYQNCQFSFKKVDRQQFSFYCLLYIFFMKCCFCKAYENAYPSNFGNEKAVSVDSEEITRRQNVAENYLKKSDNGEKDWIETYHENFKANSLLNFKKTAQNSPESEHRIHVVPFQNEDLPSLKNLDDSVHQHESLLNRKNFVNNPKDETVSFKKIMDQILQETFKTNENGEANEDILNSDNVETADPRVPAEISISSKMYKHPGNSHTKPRSKSNKLKKKSKSCEMAKDRKSDSNVKYFSFVKTDDLRLNEFKNLSVYASKIIQIMLKNSEYVSEKYFINGETLTLTEFYKLKENLASLSFLQRSKNNVYSISRMNIIDSIGKITPLLKQDKFYGVKSKQFCKFSFSDNDTATELFCFKDDDDLKKSETHLEKRVGYRADSNKLTFKKQTKDLSLLGTTNYKKSMLLSNVERSYRKDFSCDSEILRRETITNNFVTSTLNNNQENWIETYHLNVLKDKPESKSTYKLQKTAEPNSEFSKVNSQEKLYIIRWINKLQNKLKDYRSGYYSLSISVSADVDKKLEDISREFDIVLFDELVNSIISNITLHNNYANTLYFNYEYISNAVFSSLNSTKIFIFISFLFIIYLSYNFSKTRTNSNLALHRILFAFVIHIKWILLTCLLIFSFSWHGYKMYQQKIAEKHSVMSRVVPSYCESILSKESGVAAHFKEFFRSVWYDEDCKKYYEAVMVDPSSEINPFSISTDLIADTVFQMLRPFARNMNSFFKALTNDLSFFQQFIIIIVAFFALIAIFYFSLSFLAFRRKYKVNFPFHLGSVEPTVFCSGSRVEEVEEKSSRDFSSTSCDASLVSYNNKTENKSCTEDIIFRENTFKIELNHFKSERAKHCVLKAPRMRHNSI